MKKPNIEIRDRCGEVHLLYANRVTTTEEYVELTNVKKNLKYDPENDHEEPYTSFHVATFYSPIYVREREGHPKAEVSYVNA